MIGPATVIKVGWPSGPAYAGSFMLDSATRGVLDGTTYTLADEILVELSGVLSAKSTTGRSARYDAPTAGTLTVNLEDPRRHLDPTNEAGPWYGAIEARRPITLASRWTLGGTVVDVPAWSGYIDDITGDYRNTTGRVTITAFDLIGLLNFTVSDSASTRPAESCAARLRYLVSLLGFPVPEGPVDTGRTLVAMPLDGDNVLALIRGIELADQGRFMVTPSGAWSYVSSLTDTAPTITVKSDPDYTAAEAPLAAAPMSSNLARYYNSISVARWFGTPQVVDLPDDIARFGRRAPTAFTEVPVSTDSDALDIASLMLLRASSRTPTPRSATINVHTVPTSAGGSVGAAAGVATTLSAAQAQTVAVVNMYATGVPTEVTSVAIVDRVTHDTAPARWTTTLDVSPVPMSIRPIELGDATLAVLDTGRVGF